MSLTTDRHRDDLEVRRRRKEARKATAPSTKPAPQSAAAARGLLGGLITGGADRAADTASYSPQRTPGQLPRTSELARPDGAGETVDRLVERVRNGTAAIASPQPDGIRPRRPAGTAELPADAAPTRRGQGREERSATRRSVRRWTAAATVLVARARPGSRSPDRGRVCIAAAEGTPGRDGAHGHDGQAVASSRSARSQFATSSPPPSSREMK